ncbi:MAG: PLP-dependent aminotransferase family protein [Propioniciclava sp.]
MPKSQTNLAVGGLIVDGPGALHQRLATGIRARIAAGQFQPGDPLPPSRTLAEDLGVSRWVVTEAYDQLRAEGFLAGRVGSSTRVATTGSTTPTETGGEGRTAAPRWNLSPALPGLDTFPRTAWRAATTRALAGLGPTDLAPGDPRGHPDLRAAVAAHLRRIRSLTTTAEEIQITQGVSEATWWLCHHLTRAGARRVALEEPTWPRLRTVAESHGLEVVGVSVDDEGLDVDHLARLHQQARIDAVFVMPTHQFPTGVAMSGSRRRALLDWAAAHESLIVEDDYDAELRYDRHPIGALASLDRDHVVYLGSVSKTLSPALRIGWCSAPAPLATALAEIRSGPGAAAGTLEQAALADLMGSGGYERHLRRVRREYRRRRAALVEALLAQTPGSTAATLDSGLHLWWRLPPGCDEDHVVSRAAALGLSLTGLADCRSRPGPPGLVLGHAQIPVHRATDVATLLTRAIRESTRGCTVGS